MNKFSETLDATFTTDWYTLDSYRSLFNSATVNLNWDNVTGTADGVIYIEITADPDDDNFISIATQVTIDSASSGDDDEYIQINNMARGIRLRYVPNNITDGDLDVVITMEK